MSAIDGLHRDEKFVLKEGLFNAAGGRCSYCCKRTGLGGGTIDHYTPKALGGMDDRENLRWACFACNTLKKDMPPEDWERVKPKPITEPQSRRIDALRKIAQRQQLGGAA